MNILKQILLYNEICKLPKTPEINFQGGNVVLSVRMPNLEIKSVKLQDAQSEDDAYALLVKSDGSYKHFPRRYENNGDFAGFVFTAMSAKHKKRENQR